MTDSQLPRYQVFLQEKPGLPYQDVGSVHAPDSELALQNARDVFVRRPECNALWVVPVSVIFSRTAQELESDVIGELESGGAREEGGRREAYYIFSKSKSIGTQTLLGELEATSPPEALRFALEKFREHKAYVWWVFASRHVTASSQEDSESMFVPAGDKPFRLSTDFHTLTAMRALRKERNE